MLRQLSIIVSLGALVSCGFDSSAGRTEIKPESGSETASNSEISLEGAEQNAADEGSVVMDFSALVGSGQGSDLQGLSLVAASPAPTPSAPVNPDGVFVITLITTKGTIVTTFDPNAEQERLNKFTKRFDKVPAGEVTAKVEQRLNNKIVATGSKKGIVKPGELLNLAIALGKISTGSVNVSVTYGSAQACKIPAGNICGQALATYACQGTIGDITYKQEIKTKCTGNAPDFFKYESCLEFDLAQNAAWKNVSCVKK